MATYIVATKMGKSTSRPTPTITERPAGVSALKELAAHRQKSVEAIEVELRLEAMIARHEFASTHLRTMWVATVCSAVIALLALTGANLMAGIVAAAMISHVWAFRMTPGRLRRMEMEAASDVQARFRTLTTEEAQEMASLSSLDPGAHAIVMRWVKSENEVRLPELEALRKWAAQL